MNTLKSFTKSETRNYKQVLEVVVHTNSYRAVGNILNKNYDDSLPCQRVVRSDGKTGGYNRGSEQKKQILEKERVSSTGY